VNVGSGTELSSVSIGVVAPGAAEQAATRIRLMAIEGPRQAKFEKRALRLRLLRPAA